MTLKITCDRIDLFQDINTGASSAECSGNIIDTVINDDQNIVYIIERPNAHTIAWRKNLDKFKLEHPICEPISFLQFYKNIINNLLTKLKEVF